MHVSHTSSEMDFYNFFNFRSPKIAGNFTASNYVHVHV